MDGSRRQTLVGVVAVLVVLGCGGWLFTEFRQWWAADRIRIADVQYRWKVDFAAFNVLHQDDFGFNPQDVAAMQRTIGDLTIDLSGPTALVIRDQTTWTGGWTAHQEEGRADAVIIVWQAPGCPLGKRTVFLRQEGQISCVLSGGPMPLTH